MSPSKLKVSLSRQRRKFRQFTLGGEWSIPLPDWVKHNLFWYFFDGVFASACDNIVITYLVLYFLALGATRTQIGLMSSFSSFASALMLIPGALLVERIGRRKEITLLFGAGVARLVILLMALLPIFLGGHTLVWAAIALAVTRDATVNLAFPAWMDVTGSIVPIEGRGRYFGSRNFMMATAGILAILVMGELITQLGQPSGYQIALVLAFVVGVLSTYSFSRLKDPKAGMVIPKPQVPFFPALKGAFDDILAHPAFLSFALVTAFWNFSINIVGPFFTVYMVENLKFTASMVGITGISASVASMLIQRKSGELSDRWGPRRIQLVCRLLIPILTFVWVFINAVWQVIVLNIFGGILWGALGLASFNLLLSLMPEAQRARYSALFQIFALLALAVGAAVGSLVVSQWGIHVAFLCSAAGRFIAALLFFRFVYLSRTIL